MIVAKLQIIIPDNNGNFNISIPTSGILYSAVLMCYDTYYKDIVIKY